MKYPLPSSALNAFETADVAQRPVTMQSLQERARACMLDITEKREELIQIAREMNSLMNAQGLKGSVAQCLADACGKSRSWAYNFIAEAVSEAALESLPGGLPPNNVATNGDGTSQKAQKNAESPDSGKSTARNFKPDLSSSALVHRGAETDGGAEEAAAPPSPKPPTDGHGTAIPQRCLPALRQAEADDLSGYVQRAAYLRAFFEKRQEDCSGIYSILVGRVQDPMNDSQEIYRMLAQCSPDYVCPQCEGEGRVLRGTCDICRGVGMVSKSMWKYLLANGTRPDLTERMKVIESGEVGI